MVSVVQDPHVASTRKDEWVVGVFFLAVGFGGGAGGIPAGCDHTGGNPTVVVSCNGFL